MKLTKDIRRAFVRAALADVPSVDYREEIRAIALADAIEALPVVVRKVWDNPKTRPFIKMNYHYYHGVSVCIPTAREEWSREDSTHKLTPENQAKVDKLAELDKAQSTLHENLRRKLETAAEACTTRKALVDLLPEFEKYLPVDEARAIKENLPAVANVVAEFAKAGWPKGKTDGAPQQTT